MLHCNVTLLCSCIFRGIYIDACAYVLILHVIFKYYIFCRAVIMLEILVFMQCNLVEISK